MSSKIILSLSTYKDLNRIGTRLKSNLASLLLINPRKTRTISGMTSWLKISRGTCQRIIECATKSKTGTDFIQLMPGNKGWQSFLNALETQGVDAPELQRISNLVAEFDEILKDQKISHNTLKKNLSTKRYEKNTQSAEVKERAELFNATRKVLGEQKEVEFCVSIMHINPGDEKHVQIHSLIHHERCDINKQARPVFMPIWSSKMKAGQNIPSTLSIEHDLEQISAEKMAFIEDYTSDHLNTETVRISNMTDTLIIAPESTDSEPFDVTMYLHYERDQLRHLKGVNHSNSIGIQVRNPCKWLYAVMFIEKGMTANSTPEAGAYAFRKTEDTLVSGVPDDIWFDRFPGSPEMLQVNSGINFSSKLQYVKANELINCLFSITKVDRSKYACYLLKVEYPIWSSVYRMYLKYDFKQQSDD